MIRSMLSGKEVSGFSPTEVQKQVFIHWFLSKKKTFNENTPGYILHSDKCIESSLKIDFNSANYLSSSLSSEYQEKIIEFLSSKPFVIWKSAPFFLAKNYQLASKSISLNPFSANNLDWFHFNSSEAEQLISQLTQTNYFLTSESPMELSSNHDVVLASIKNNIYSSHFASSELKSEEDIFNYLLFHDGCTFRDVKNIELSRLLDSTYMHRCFQACSFYRSTSPSYIFNMNSLFQNLFQSKITIRQCDLIFENFAEKSWYDYQSENADICDNIFGKICAELKRNSSFDSAISELKFLSLMSNVLGKKYHTLYSAMREFYDISHSHSEDQYEKLETSRDTIACLSASYISKMKENYKKEKIEEYRKIIYPFFTPREDNLRIESLLKYQQQKKKFQNLYQSNDQEVCNFIISLKNSYQELLGSVEMDKFIDEFIKKGNSRVMSILGEPDGYQAYLMYKKVLKLVHRLNSHYISFDGPEVKNYKSFIGYDSNKNEYHSLILEPTFEMLKQYMEYDKKNKILQKLKREVVEKIKMVEVDLEFNYKNLKKLSLSVPFNDEYYVFDTDNILDLFCIEDLYHQVFSKIACSSLDAFMIEENYRMLSDILIDDGYLWFRLLLSKSMSSFESEFNNFEENFIQDLINNTASIRHLSELFHMDVHDYEQLSLLLKLQRIVDMKTIAIMDENLIKTLSEDLSYTNHNPSEIISRAEQLVCSMLTKGDFTVPRVHGQTLNYKYSMYDQQDLSVLLAGINTFACFRVCGNDNDFFHYCLLDKNGFVIKIEDVYGNFIARAGGFRHGNSVFINQLRSIYDNHGFSSGSLDAEKNEIIEAFERACNDIVTISQNNDQEQNKIDYVFVTNGYTLRDYKCNVDSKLVTEIGSFPMDSSSDDWKKFLKSTKHMTYCLKNGFFTDYGSKSLICIASKNDELSYPGCLNFYDAPSVYQRERNRIIVSDQTDDDIFRKINRIKAASIDFVNRNFEFMEIPDDALTVVGDNWYIICDNHHMIDSCVLKGDSCAKKEFDAVSSILNKEIDCHKKDSIDISQIASLLGSKDDSTGNKVLMKDYLTKKD